MFNVRYEKEEEQEAVTKACQLHNTSARSVQWISVVSWKTSHPNAKCLVMAGVPHWLCTCKEPQWCSAEQPQSRFPSSHLAPVLSSLSRFPKTTDLNA